MANARELLDQADALMHRGRPAADEDIPVLIDVVDTVMPLAPEVDAAAFSESLAATPEAASADALASALPYTQELATALVAVDPKVQALAEQVYVLVMQRLDLYTEKALQDHLARHLQPVIERAGREIVAAVNANIGELLRTFIAESVEREIAQLREQQRTPKL